MDQTLFTLPILDGKADAARAFLNELESTRKGQYAASEERLRLVQDISSTALTPGGSAASGGFSETRKEASIRGISHL